MDGKQFEKHIQESAEKQGIDCTRLKDAGWTGEQTERRFTVSNICDFILYDGKTLFFVEAKKRKSSLRFDALKHQDKLIKKYEKGLPNLKVGYLIQFDNKPTLWLDCLDVPLLKSALGKLSFNYNDLKGKALKVETWIPQGARKPRLNLTKLMSV